jgi:glycine/D-amino acid oxidase-like deaminating enzyme
MDQGSTALEGSIFKPFWLDQAARPARLGALAGAQSCELLIVGGGFTGLWAALQAKERRPDLDIILIEASEVGEGASGRNGGFLSSSLAHGDHNTDFHFPNERDKLYDLGRQNMDEFIASLDRYGIDARYERTGEIEVNTRSDQDEGMAEWVEEERADGYDLVWFDREEMQAEVHSPTYWGGVWDREGHDGLVDPAYLCWGLKRAVRDLGVRIFEGTPMVRLDRQGDGIRLECPHGSIRAQKVFMATNAFRNPIRSARRRVIPVWDYVIATEPLTPDQMQSIGWKRRQGLGNNANMFHYYRLTHDNRIVWGGGVNVAYYYGSRTRGSVADSRKRFERNASDFFETFPQLEGIRFSHRWSGLIGSTTRFCMSPGVAFDGRVSWSVGYTGQGVGASRFGARIGLELLGYDPTEILDLQFVRRPAMIWPPEPLRWAGVTLTRKEMGRADRNQGRRSLWLKLLDRLGVGFAC